MTWPAWLAAVAGGAFALGPLLIVGGLRRASDAPAVVRPPVTWRRRLAALQRSARVDGAGRSGHRRRIAAWMSAGLALWIVTGWPAAGIAVSVVGVWMPWLLGSARVAQQQIDRLESLESWCRRMADTLAGGGAIGLTQAVNATVETADDLVAAPVAALARRLRTGTDPASAVRSFADAIDDRVGDTVAAALLLALHQQSNGIARVLRQLAEGVARDVRARRDIEAERAESRQSIRMLLIIQAGVLVLLALVPGFAAPYGTPVGQIVMAVLLSGTIALMVWMRRLALGRRSPRFLVAKPEPT